MVLVFILLFNPSYYDLDNVKSYKKKIFKELELSKNFLYVLFEMELENDQAHFLIDDDKNTFFDYDGYFKQLEFRTYTIKFGDILIDISKKYNVDIDTIISFNNIENVKTLRIGENLIIPNIKGILHKVEKNENLWDISRKYKKYNVRLKDVIYINNIHKKDKLFPGERLFIPGAKLLNQYNINPNIFAKPVSGIPVSPVGRRLHPIYRNYRFHSGLDIKASYNSPVRVGRSGKVIFAGWKGSYGKLIIVNHGKGLETRYGHLSKILVRKGTWIKRGKLIGKVGSTGLSTGPHLHFEVRRNNRPRKILRKFKGLYGHIGKPW